MMQKKEGMMHIFDYTEGPAGLMRPEIARLLNTVHELKGEVGGYAMSAPALLPVLREIACVQSTGASNRIEGIITTTPRLKALMEHKTTPRNRSEEEIAGYRDVLSTIHQHYEYIPPTPSYILQLHRDLYAYTGTGGDWKSTDNVISEQLPDGTRRVRFAPVPAHRTPEAMESLCTAFRRAVEDAEWPPLLLIPMFVLDFLCIHPFLDGNGRMSRLLTTLLLSRSGYDVGRYISLEQLVDTAKDGYYEALQASSQGWHDNANDYAPFVRYSLGIIAKAYTEWKNRLQAAAIRKKSKADRIRDIFATTLAPIGKAEIAARCPDISVITIERALRALLAEGYITRLNKGRATVYIRTAPPVR